MSVIRLLKSLPHVWAIRGEVSQVGWYRSRTIVFNVLSAGIAIGAIFGYVVPVTGEGLDDLSNILSRLSDVVVELVGLIGLLVANLTNIWLRRHTAVPVGRTTVHRDETGANDRGISPDP